MEQSGLQIVDMHGVFDRVQAQFVRAAHHLPALNSPPGQPHAEAAGLMVAARLSRLVDLRLAHGGASELPAPDHQRIVQQAPLFQILKQGGRGLIRIVGVFPQPLFDFVVEIPVGVDERDEAHTPLDQPPGQQTVGGIGLCPFPLTIDSVGLQKALWLLGEVEQLRRRHLHPKGQFVGGDPGGDLLIPLLRIAPSR